MKNFSVALLFTIASLVPLARAGEVTSDIPVPKVPLSARWKWSLAPLVASQGLDIYSSYGMRELNPLLADRQGQFGVQSAVLKVSVTAGLIGVEYLIVKAHPASARMFTKLNWGAAALTTGFAVHNFAIK
jgi:hypothetical protein